MNANANQFIFIFNNKFRFSNSRRISLNTQQSNLVSVSFIRGAKKKKKKRKVDLYVLYVDHPKNKQH